MIQNSLNTENYFSPENNHLYMGSSQFKAFMNCEAQALAEINGEYKRETTDALLAGSYIDAFFEGTLDDFKAKNPEIFTKSGELKANYRHIENVIERVCRDKRFMQYMSGEKQKIFTGEIAGVPFKIKVDSFHPFAIVDLKCVRDFQPVWNAHEGIRQHFALYWRYDIQGAIYREIVRQNIGKTLPFYLAVCTKEKQPDIDLICIDDSFLDNALNEVKALAPRFQRIKNGEIQPEKCCECDYCKSVKKITAPVYLSELCGDIL